jgi:hypothetical protein
MLRREGTLILFMPELGVAAMYLISGSKTNDYATRQHPERHLGDAQTNAVRPRPEWQLNLDRYANERDNHWPHSGWLAKNFHIS